MYQVRSLTKKEQDMLCSTCHGHKRVLVDAIIKCDAFGQHIQPGSGTWKDCEKCGATGEVLAEGEQASVPEQRKYRVMWSRPGYPKRASVAGTFPANDDAAARKIFEENYKHNHVYGGDELTLLCIIQSEVTQLIEKREAPKNQGSQ